MHASSSHDSRTDRTIHQPEFSPDPLVLRPTVILEPAQSCHWKDGRRVLPRNYPPLSPVRKQKLRNRIYLEIVAGVPNLPYASFKHPDPLWTDLRQRNSITICSAAHANARRTLPDRTRVDLVHSTMHRRASRNLQSGGLAECVLKDRSFNPYRIRTEQRSVRCMRPYSSHTRTQSVGRLVLTGTN